MSAGIVYLRTNRFEVKLEGITFKATDFDSVVSSNEFLFPKGKIWAHPPIVGIDVMRHPRDPSTVLLILCFGVGCVILKFHSGDILPESISKFLMNERIQFVGFGIPEKLELFPFEKLGLKKYKVDIGYLAAKLLDDPKYKRCELADLARKVLRIKTMIGLTEASSFERHEHIKCAICQLFITWAISMALLRSSKNKNRSSETDSPRKNSFLKHLNSLPTLTEGWFKSDKFKNFDGSPLSTIKKTDFDSSNRKSNNNNNTNSPSKKHSFLKNFNSLPGLSETWFKFDKFKKEDDHPTAIKKSCSRDDLYIKNTADLVDNSGTGGDGDNKESISKMNALMKGPTWNSFKQATIKAGDFLRDQVNLVAKKEFTKANLLKSKSGSDRMNRSFTDHGISNQNPSNNEKPLKGILKCHTKSTPQTPKHPNPPQEQNAAKPTFRRSVSFK